MPKRTQHRDPPAGGPPLSLQPGDVVILRELVPRLRPGRSPSWRFRVCVHPAPVSEGNVFTSFQHAASTAEQLATDRRARLLFVEDDVTTLLNDYRR